MSEVSSYYDGFQKRLINDFLNDNIRVRAALNFIIESMIQKAEVAEYKVLDIGCGIGWSSYELGKTFPNSKIFGIDISDNLISTAEKVFSKPNIKFTIQNLEEGLPKFDEQFNVVTLIDVFEHIPKELREQFAGQLQQILESQFDIYLTCPTIYHQNHLRVNSPENLQPYDEDIDFSVIGDFAKMLNAEVTYFSYKSIWASNDYLHARITKGVTYKDMKQLNSVGRTYTPLNYGEKVQLLKRAGISVDVKKTGILKKIFGKEN